MTGPALLYYLHLFGGESFSDQIFGFQTFQGFFKQNPNPSSELINSWGKLENSKFLIQKTKQSKEFL